MKQKMQKVINFLKLKFSKLCAWCKKNYVASAVIASLIAIILGSLIVIGIIKHNKNKISYKTVNVNCFEFFDGEKESFKTKFNLENDKVVSVDSSSSLSSGIVYFKDGVLLPNKSTVVLLGENNNQYKLNKYSRVFYKNKNFLISSEGKLDSEYNFFVYDGNDTYFFPYESVVEVNGMTYELGKMSYIEVNSNYAFIYDREGDHEYYIKDKINSCKVSYLGVRIEAYQDVLKEDNDIKLILKNIDDMNVYKEAE